MRATFRQYRIIGDAFPQGYPTCHHMSHMPPHGMVVAPRKARDVPRPMCLAPRWQAGPRCGAARPSLCRTSCAEGFEPWRPAAHARAPHERRVVVKGRAEQGRHREDDVRLDHPRAEPLAHLAHPVGDGNCGTPQAPGPLTTHRPPRGALATVQATLCERTHRVRAPTREHLRHQTIIVDRLIAQMGVCEPVLAIGTHLLADSPVS